MVKQEQIFILIKSLSRNEKRYFKVFCGKENGAANYLKLFDTIDKQESYDETAIKKKFKGETFTKQLHVTKNYLHKLILKSLRDFHAGISKNAELKDLLRNVEILFNKELYQLSLNELKRAEQIATDFELNYGLAEVYEWKRRLEQQARPHSYAEFERLLTLQNETLNQLIKTNHYWQLTTNLTAKLTSRQELESKYMYLLEDPDNAKTLEETVLHYNSIYFKCITDDNIEEAQATLLKLVELLEQDPKRLRHNMSLYASSVNNLISYLVYTKKHDMALSYINRAKNIYAQWKLVSENKTILKQVLRTYNVELEIYRDNKTYKANKEYIESIDQFIAANENKMPNEYKLSTSFQLASIHFVLKNYSRSMRWINIILNNKFKGQRQDILIQARLLNLMVHLEQQNMFVLRHFVESTKRFINKLGDIAEYQKILLRFFSKIGKAYPYEYKELYLELYNQLFPENEESPLSQSAIDFIDYKTWIEEKL